MMERISDKGFDREEEQDIKNTLVCTNIVGGFATRKKGVIGEVPSLKEIIELLAKHQ